MSVKITFFDDGSVNIRSNSANRPNHILLMKDEMQDVMDKFIQRQLEQLE